MLKFEIDYYLWTDIINNNICDELWFKCGLAASNHISDHEWYN